MQLQLSILTPEGPVRQSAFVSGVEVPGLLGEVGILPGHEPFVTAVQTGVVRFREGDKSVRIAVGSGVCEVQATPGSALTEVTILVDRAVEAHKVAVVSVQDSLREISGRLKLISSSIDNPEVMALLEERKFLEAQLRAAAS